eukprot:jgi/Orpsp1_1/1191923/evm.model.d7180000089387.1
MNKFNFITILIVLLLLVQNAYSVDHSLGSDLEIKPSVIDKMKKEKFTYSYKELKNKRKVLNGKCSTFRGKVIYVLNYFAKMGESFKSTIENAIDNSDMKKFGIYILVGSFVLWYIRRVIKNSFFNKKKVNIYFNESENYKDKSYQDLSYQYYDNTSYLSNNNSYQYLNSYGSNMNCGSPYQTREVPKQKKINVSRYFSQRKRKDSNDENNNLYSYAYV